MTLSVLEGYSRLCKPFQVPYFVFVARRAYCLPRDAMLARYMLSSCLSVRVSVTGQYCVKTAELQIMHTTPHNSAGTLVFWCQRCRRNSNRV